MPRRFGQHRQPRSQNAASSLARRASVGRPASGLQLPRSAVKAAPSAGLQGIACVASPAAQLGSSAAPTVRLALCSMVGARQAASAATRVTRHRSPSGQQSRSAANARRYGCRPPGQPRAPAGTRVRPNMSLNRSANGRPAWPCGRLGSSSAARPSRPAAVARLALR